MIERLLIGRIIADRITSRNQNLGRVTEIGGGERETEFRGEGFTSPPLLRDIERDHMALEELAAESSMRFLAARNPRLPLRSILGSVPTSHRGLSR